MFNLNSRSKRNILDKTIRYSVPHTNSGRNPTTDKRAILTQNPGTEILRYSSTSYGEKKSNPPKNIGKSAVSKKSGFFWSFFKEKFCFLKYFMKGF